MSLPLFAGAKLVATVETAGDGPRLHYDPS